jgi:hypothetical protein
MSSAPCRFCQHWVGSRSAGSTGLVSECYQCCSVHGPAARPSVKGGIVVNFTHPRIESRLYRRVGASTRAAVTEGLKVTHAATDHEIVYYQLNQTVLVTANLSVAYRLLPCN